MSTKGVLLQHVDNKPLREKILDTLREAIVSGDFKPGHPLLENDLAAQLGVSRAPLREAFQILASEGLVETIPYKGTIVRHLSRQDIEELYTLRCVLEQFAIRRVIAAGHIEDVATLRGIYEEMLAAAVQGNLKAVNEIDRHFHDTLIALSQHHLLTETWSTVTLRVRQVMALRNRRNSDLTQIAYNHVPIIEAVARGSESEAMDLIEKHVVTSLDLIVELWDDGAEASTEETAP
ncbi:MAG: GntR family transcriptional regulator [Pleurocapsa minor GSE-CHR-MK-17-07R]|jgi:DNA-binding GntR family transcriptional regulator|nr:GntR family transcriptional regulator [Pleurocapsa minor GSE-CHR-MK 17-07R]